MFGYYDGDVWKWKSWGSHDDATVLFVFPGWNKKIVLKNILIIKKFGQKFEYKKFGLKIC